MCQDTLGVRHSEVDTPETEACPNDSNTCKKTGNSKDSSTRHATIVTIVTNHRHDDSSKNSNTIYDSLGSCCSHGWFSKIVFRLGLLGSLL